MRLLNAIARPVPIALVTAGVAAVVYAATAAPGLYWGDSAELALQAQRLGITHPPGYPLHSLLGHLFGAVFREPADATTALSIASAVVAVGVLAAISAAVAGAPAGFIAGLIFGLHPFVWPAAIHTETYSVNMALVAVVLAALAWPGPLSVRRMWIAIVVFALSFGTSPANALLFPGVLVLLASRSSDGRLRCSIAFVLAVSAAGAAIMVWTIARTKTFPPLGTSVVPDDVGGFLRFVTGGDYGVLAPHPPRFYLDRTINHATAFLTDVAWVGGALGVMGLVRHWRADRATAIGLCLAAAGNFGYFTYHPWPDYRAMLTPTYFVFAHWCGVGVSGFFASITRDAGTMAGRHPSALRVRHAIGVFVLVALPVWVAARAARSQGEEPFPGGAEAFVNEAVSVLPTGAIVISKWIYFTPLLYAQEVRGFRPDVELIELADRPRAYRQGRVTSWKERVEAAANNRPVVTNVPAATAFMGWETVPLGSGWSHLLPPARRAN